MSASPQRDTVSTIPFFQARRDASRASSGSPFGLGEGGSRTPQPPLPQSALTGLLALVELKNGSERPSCERTIVRSAAVLTLAVTVYGERVSMPDAASSP